MTTKKKTTHNSDSAAHINNHKNNINKNSATWIQKDKHNHRDRHLNIKKKQMI